MGAYLDTPITDKNSEVDFNEQASWGLCSMQGWRCNMEDDHIAQQLEQANGKKGMLFCVFDGHGGKEVAQYAKERFVDIFINTQDFKNQKYAEALTDCFMKLDTEIKSKEYGADTGATSCVVYFNDDKIYCANAGDSRGVMYQGTKVVALSEDHKPDNAEELARIQKAEHFVEDSRVDGNLALSRAIGDFQYKDQPKLSAKEQAVSAFPDITINSRTNEDKYIILACDGIWDCLSNDEACAKVNQLQKEMKPNNKTTHKIVEKIFEQILAPNTEDGLGTDNMTCILIYFPKN